MHWPSGLLAPSKSASDAKWHGGSGTKLFWVTWSPESELVTCALPLGQPLPVEMSVIFFIISRAGVHSTNLTN
jgi:hypothetical protein